MLAIAAIALFPTLQAPATKLHAPVLLRGAIAPGRCRVPIDVNGSIYLFLADTGIDHSYLRPDLKKSLIAEDPKATISFGAVSKPVNEFGSTQSTLYKEMPAVAGIIGMDVLQRQCFSIDYGAQTMTLWPDDTPDADLKKDLGVDLVSVPLMTEEGTPSLFVQTSLGECAIDTGAVLSLLPKTAAQSPEVFPTKIGQTLELFDGTGGKATQTFVRNFSIGDQKLFCQQYLLSDTTNVGVISPNLFAARVLFDFPRKRIMFNAPNQRWLACRTIGALLHGEVKERSGEPYLKAQLAKNLGHRDDGWVRIVEINGNKGSDLLKMLENGDQLAASIVQHAYDSLASGGTVLIEHGGKQERLYVAPYLK